MGHHNGTPDTRSVSLSGPSGIHHASGLHACCGRCHGIMARATARAAAPISARRPRNEVNVSFDQIARLFPQSTSVNNLGHLELGGCDATALAKRFGTPLYVFCEETLRNQCKAFLQGFSKHYPKVRVVFAGKAYVNPALARIFQEEGLGLDVVSGGELAV
ncbi:MAG: hypothetical protein FJ315_07290, partial [SAR202 cluster bacterium]|nr:hypothetical protein [SAR202 cluster bacterium]